LRSEQPPEETTEMPAALTRERAVAWLSFWAETAVARTAVMMAANWIIVRYVKKCGEREAGVQISLLTDLHDDGLVCEEELERSEE
jgi:hypothetical protein